MSKTRHIDNAMCDAREERTRMQRPAAFDRPIRVADLVGHLIASETNHHGMDPYRFL